MITSEKPNERRLEVTVGSDGLVVISSLGGGMPVIIRASEEETLQLIEDLTDTLINYFGV